MNPAESEYGWTCRYPKRSVALALAVNQKKTVALRSTTYEIFFDHLALVVNQMEAVALALTVIQTKAVTVIQTKAVVLER